MKRFGKSMLGVTLLEIMLVLAIAAMIIVMSVRYYQSASANQQANSALQMIQGITASADGLAQGTGSYSTISTSSVQALMPNKSMMTPWGGTITVAAQGATSYTVTIDQMPEAVCLQLKSRMASNTKYTAISSCSGVTTFSYTYISTQ
jgi:Tfp pilus assembly protein FimT